jgi:hypothetical protein
MFRKCSSQQAAQCVVASGGKIIVDSGTSGQHQPCESGKRQQTKQTGRAPPAAGASFSCIRTRFA